ncbi:MAG: FAD-dependent oxidoreductase [Sandaracinaceae bacterium]|nr:FAD-dependent oxidoreductase [Sandaracinaceae bacterium]
MKKRVVIAGLGETGLLVALGLHPDFDVIGISPKLAVVSGQELGTRIARPRDWQENYLTDFSRYRKLRGMAIRHGLITSLTPDQNQLAIQNADGTEETLTYDALVLSMGVTSGFWRSATLETREDVERGIADVAAQLAAAGSIAIVGGGATAASSASNLKETYPEKTVTLFYGQRGLLPDYHPKVRKKVTARLAAQGVDLRPDHRAVMPAGFAGERLTREPLQFESGQAPFTADVVLWAVGQQRPNTGFVPASMLDAHGYVRADAQLRVPGFANVFTVGDVAATDPNRSSARNGGFLTVAHNIRCLFAGREARMNAFEPTPHRWGSVLGVQAGGMRVFAPTGFSVNIGAFWVKNVLFPWIVRGGIYKGVDAPADRQ